MSDNVYSISDYFEREDQFDHIVYRCKYVSNHIEYLPYIDRCSRMCLETLSIALVFRVRFNYIYFSLTPSVLTKAMVEKPSCYK